MRFSAIVAKVSPASMEELARKAREAFPDIPFSKRVDYSRRVACHGYSWTMDLDELTKAAWIIGEEDQFIPRSLALTPKSVWVYGKYARTNASVKAEIQILERAEADNDSEEILREIPIDTHPVNVYFQVFY